MLYRIITTVATVNAAGIFESLCESPFLVPSSLSTSTVGCLVAMGLNISLTPCINRSPHDPFILRTPSCMNYPLDAFNYISFPVHMFLCFSPLHLHPQLLVSAPVTVAKRLSTRSMFSLCYDMSDSSPLFTLSCIGVYPFIPQCAVNLGPLCHVYLYIFFFIPTLHHSY